MPTSSIQFNGINRAVSDYSLSGSCEELINLRPTPTGLVPYKKAVTKMAAVTWAQVLEHNLGNNVNYIGVKPESTTCKFWRLNPDGTAAEGSAFASLPIRTGTNLEQIHTAFIGNIFVISCTNPSSIGTEAYRWENGAYTKIEVYPPTTGITPSMGTPTLQRFKGAPMTDMTRAERVETLLAEFEAIQANNPTLCFGPFIYAMALKTTSGETFWTSEWGIVDPAPLIISTNPGIIYDVTDNKFNAATLYEDRHWAFLAGLPVTVTLQRVTNWNNLSSIFKSIEVYTSRPVLYYNTDSYLEEDASSSSDPAYIRMDRLMPKDMALGGQLLYLQKSIPLDELASAGTSFTLKFGGVVQTTSTTLKVDAGRIRRAGKMLAYNARIHFYDSIKQYYFSQVGTNGASFSSGSLMSGFIAYAVKTSDGEKIVRMGSSQVSVPTNDDEAIIIAPFSNITTVYLYYLQDSTTYRVHIYPMAKSDSYNFSYFIGGKHSIVLEGAAGAHMSRILAASTPVSYLSEEETTALNVSEQYDPFFFEVRHSYVAPGKILDVQPQLVAVPDVEFGDYPLNVFTDRGVFALIQGDGTVLYSNFRPVSENILQSNCAVTDMGTFFIASGGLYLVAGRRAVLISEALSRGPWKFIRSNTQYPALTHSASLYNIENYESKVDFETFCNGATLSYNRFRNEVVVSNPGYAYSYVINLNYRQWFKIGYSFSQAAAGANLVMDASNNVLDFSDENGSGEVLVHLQSRPFSPGEFQYSHIHRIVAMLRADLDSSHNLSVNLFGSDNLQEWTLLASAQRSDAKFSQIRTAPSARSWRYYTLVIGGKVLTYRQTTAVAVAKDPDFGPILIDWTPIVRRIG